VAALARSYTKLPPIRPMRHKAKPARLQRIAPIASSTRAKGAEQAQPTAGRERVLMRYSDVPAA